MLSSAPKLPSAQEPNPLGPRSHDGIGSINVPAIVIRAERDSELVPQGQPSRFYYYVLHGCVRTVCLLEDGRRQIGEFLFPGDLLDTDQIFGAEAVTQVALRRIPRATIDERLGTDPSFAAWLRAHAAHQIRAAGSRCLLLGRKTAAERVASFLLEMALRLETGPHGTVALPMGRNDIADYLGLTTETVCRALTQLRQLKLIRVNRNAVAIVSHAGLAQAAAEPVH